MRKKENRGGARAGAGRPRKKKTVSEKIRAAYMKAARELAKEHGEPLEKAMLRMIYKDDVQDSVKASIMKTYNDALLIRESESKLKVDDNRALGPTIYRENDRGEMVVVRPGNPAIGLLEMMPDPARQIIKKDNESEK
jgi:hypothetical protein